MGCQKAITQDIINTKGDYAIAVKANQKNLYQQIVAHFDELCDVDYYKPVEINKVASSKKKFS